MTALPNQECHAWAPSPRGRRIAADKYLELVLEGSAGNSTIEELARAWGTSRSELRRWVEEIYPERLRQLGGRTRRFKQQTRG